MAPVSISQTRSACLQAAVRLMDRTSGRPAQAKSLKVCSSPLGLVWPHLPSSWPVTQRNTLGHGHSNPCAAGQMLVLGAEKERNVCVGTFNLECYAGTELGYWFVF